MTTPLGATDAVVRADCEACPWTHERALTAGDDLSAEDNQEIAARLARAHEHRCPESGEEWAATVAVDVAIDATGGEPDAR
ncbi:hypothetical protein A6E15_19215 [Natrinema saccharevitans]|uniref:Uncharacterized protein n=1 Tax=Natrinema saccharevitans TaxID=301967 RepID=A0A1S8AQU1_9EURY|nr:hypothetical protein [Natrinema saccharevitans]OLZ39095.1 hypothetical protein A6E15_19215 [Natrinema saccharevitans]